ncbi:formate--tetrahydrofolate ligase [Moraxella nonliquefaciens]|uniref:formate--tetrahydrofolate ligase n=1 Tax=Moraxella nonliquefaciens TaxID=478 RepID=UPI0024ACD4F1|nr:formate--tetrahydrofolate ligase [Moraxella nonliquefaciens]MDI4497388.1 formate--tetrahydrofolate ligase [Moraxella nonliquefaciens]
MTQLTDAQIASNALKTIAPISDVAQKLGLSDDDIEHYGKYKAKIRHTTTTDHKGKLILVTAINPTPAGEGKTTLAIGLADALSALDKRAVLALREPSLGPVFGIKGGATGGGQAQVIPMEDINLHFTGDFHAITSANNLLSALIDNHIHHGNELGINPKKVLWRRVLDMNDRFLRHIMGGMGKPSDGVIRPDGFDITVASEIMAVFCLAQDLDDLNERLGNMMVAYRFDNTPVFAKDLKAQGAMSALLKTAFAPNLVQTMAGTPTLIHGGPFANIAHGCNSVVATKLGLALGDYVVTEAGFGADLGAEKFCNIKCRLAELRPDAVVVVATVRALKYNGGVSKDDLTDENLNALSQGLPNLLKHVDNMKSKFGLPVVVAINRFASDSDAELALIEQACHDEHVAVSLCDVWAKGGQGGLDLAQKVIDATHTPNHFTLTYDDNTNVKDKISAIATTIYGAKDVSFSAKALSDIEIIDKLGLSHLPICMAKTQYSLSDNPKALGIPTDFTINVREMTILHGAGFLVALCGDIMKMPGLPKAPAAINIDVIDGEIVGLF